MKKFIFCTDIHLSSINPGSRIDNYTDAVFNKIEYLFKRCKEENAILLLGGDLFMTPTMPDYIKNRLKTIILQSKIRVLSIVGNHDLLYYNEEYIDRTSFQSLVSPGVIEYLGDFVNNTVTVDDWNIVGHIFGKPFPEVTNEKSIILSHSFYDYKKEGEKLLVTRDEVNKSNAWVVCFGHDHNQYPVENNNNTLVVRPGALTRGTSHTENRIRQVGFAVITVDKDKVDLKYETIPFALKFEEVFRQNYEVTREHKVTSFDEIQKFIDDLRSTKIEINAYDILLGMNKSDKIVKRCTNYMEAVGLFS